MGGELRPEDYIEPRCVLCEEPYGVTKDVKPVPQQRIIEKMDEYMAHRDYAGAERHLLYWLEEAKLGEDLRGQLMLRNELTGHYRKTGDREKSLANAEEALRLLSVLEFEGTISSGTTYVNAATACNAFGENERSLALFEKARAVYEANLRTDRALLGGLYNNMALTNAALGRYEEAMPLFEKALEAMGEVPNGGLEQAITYLNMADLLDARYGMEQREKEICEYLDRAADLLDETQPAGRQAAGQQADESREDPAKTENAGPDPGYYAFVCEKCAPAFSYYGYFLTAEELERRAKEIYGRT